MDCNLEDQQLIPYILGTLGSAERESMQTHAESCAHCRRRMQDEGETVTRFAFAVPQLEAPAHLKDRLFARIEAVDGPVVRRRNDSKWALIDKGLFSLPTAGAVASVLLFGVIFGGVWFNGRWNEVSGGNGGIVEQGVKSNEDLSDMVSSSAYIGPKAMDTVGEQSSHTYDASRVSAAPGPSVNMLWGTGGGAKARGMLMVSRSGSQALLLALDLRPLPPDKVYQVWLIKDGRKYSGGYFTVDSSGYGQTLIFPYPSIAEFEGIGITIEPLGGSSGPTGTSVLKGDL